MLSLLLADSASGDGVVGVTGTSGPGKRNGIEWEFRNGFLQMEDLEE